MATAMLAAGGSVTFTLTATINATTTNTVTVSAAAGGQTASFTATATVTSHVCTITLTKTVDDADVCSGDTVTYSYVVHNNSDQFTWTGDITDDNGTPGDASDDFTVASGVVVGPGLDSATYTHDSVIGTGSVTNTATASGDFDDPASTSASDTDTASTEGHVCTITLTKTPNKTTVCNGANEQAYTYVVTNTGDFFNASGTLVDDNGTPANGGRHRRGQLGLWRQAHCDLTSTRTSTPRRRTSHGLGTSGGKCVSATASATVTGRSCETSQLAPTQTTCAQFAAGTAPVEDTIFYGLQNGVINNVSPGVLFYYTSVTAPASGTLTFILRPTTSLASRCSEFRASRCSTPIAPTGRRRSTPLAASRPSPLVV
jgi:hypothetical protein